jgi:hypothetical protein
VESSIIRFFFKSNSRLQGRRRRRRGYVCGDDIPTTMAMIGGKCY